MYFLVSNLIVKVCDDITNTRSV